MLREDCTAQCLDSLSSCGGILPLALGTRSPTCSQHAGRFPSNTVGDQISTPRNSLSSRVCASGNPLGGKRTITLGSSTMVYCLRWRPDGGNNHLWCTTNSVSFKGSNEAAGIPIHVSSMCSYLGYCAHCSIVLYLIFYELIS